MSHIQRPRAQRGRTSGRPAPVFPPAAVEHRRRILPDPHADEAERLQSRYGRLQRATMLCGEMILREMAAARAEQAAAAREQARRACAPEARPDAVADRGTQGPAMLARGVRVEDVLVDVIEHAGGTHLDRASVARVRDGVIDHYERAGVLWGRRLDAMVQLADLYQGSRVAPGTGHSGGGRGYGQMSTGQARAWADYCKATDHLSPGVRPVVEDVARGLFPGALDAVAKLRDGAWQLADYFRLSPDKIEERSA